MSGYAAELALIRAIAKIHETDNFLDIGDAMMEIEGLIVGGHLPAAHVRHVMEQSGCVDFVMPENEFLFHE